MDRTLVIGFGNLDRADDGVAFHVVNAFRRRLGQAALAEDDTGLERLGLSVDSVFIGQLVPEMMDLLEGYGRVLFVDAHVDPALGDVYCAPVSAEDAGLTFTHHMSPSTLLAFYKAIHGRDLEGHLVSVRGRDFDFRRSLSPETLALVEPAVERLAALVRPGVPS
ncbi:MAG: hydrogenase maturation protease [Syntrophaceae bacterium]|nr:hydrogenase maturation protease [Syntrophaceae bacterium]